MAYKGRAWRSKAKARRKRDAKLLDERIRTLNGPVRVYVDESVRRQAHAPGDDATQPVTG